MLGSQTQVVNGQRNTFPTFAQYTPMGYGPQTTGVPQVSPTMPPFIGAANSGSAVGSNGVGGYGTAANNDVVTQLAHDNPHNWRVSPVWWAIGLLILGLLLLQGVHWRKVTLAGFEGDATAGPVHAGGGAKVDD